MIGWCIAAVRSPGFALSVDVGNAPLLHQRFDAAARFKRRVENAAGADAIGLAGILTDDARVRSTVDCGQLS